MPFALNTFLFGPVPEELGRRGYALDGLQSRGELFDLSARASLYKPGLLVLLAFVVALMWGRQAFVHSPQGDATEISSARNW